MSHESTKSTFGIDDVLDCPHRGGRMMLSRREPSPEFGLNFERQTFLCLECSKPFEREVGGDGGAPL
jgi:hypothetical protein